MGSQPPPLRLAILEADTPVPGIAAKYHTYGGVFRHLFTRALSPQPLDTALSITHHDVVNGDFASAYPDPDAIDAILITGSKHNSFDSDPWIQKLVEYTRAILDGGKVRVVGVCFGHQIVARALGAQVGRNDKGWEISVVPLSLNAEGQKIFSEAIVGTGVPGDNVDDKTTLRIHQMHRDAVLTLPPSSTAAGEVIPLARTDVCELQAFYIPGRMIAVQGHPEFTEEMVREILELRKYGGILNEDVYNDGVRRVGDKHDGEGIARVFLRFMRGEI